MPAKPGLYRTDPAGVTAFQTDFDLDFADRRTTERRRLAVDTQRLWVSDGQWQRMVDALNAADTRDAELAGGLSGATGQRQHARLAPDQCRCVLRLHVIHAEAAPAAGGTFAVGLRNIGAGGLNFVHHAAVEPDTRATLLLQGADASGATAGEIVAARVIWCNLLQQQTETNRTYHVGLEFDRPLPEASPFL